jgi:hypothetical protein
MEMLIDFARRGFWSSPSFVRTTGLKMRLKSREIKERGQTTFRANWGESEIARTGKVTSTGVTWREVSGYERKARKDGAPLGEERESLTIV